MNNQTKISIIIPVINEEKIIIKNLNFLKKFNDIDVIFVDGGSEDNTVKLIQSKGFNCLLSPILRRSYQMNLGAKKATGDVLLFLHSDTILPDNFQDLIRNSINQKNFIAGAFSLTIDNPKYIFRILETLIKIRTILFSLPYGDQAIFLKKNIFEQIKGYEDLAIMEDFNLMQKLRKKGKIYLISESVITSARRWEKLGIFYTTLINQLMVIGYSLGINSDTLAKVYRHSKGSIK